MCINPTVREIFAKEVRIEHTPLQSPRHQMEPTILEGNHVRLEPLSMNHLDDLCRHGLEEHLWTWIPQPVQTRNDMAGYIEAALAGQKTGTMLPFATIAKESGEAVGSTRFGSIDLENRRMEIGWTWIVRPWQRTAINTETKLLMLKYAFNNVGCNRVEFKTDAMNLRSRTAILRLGAQEEGTLRKHIVTTSGRLRDTVYYSITNEEWPTIKDRLKEILKNCN